VRRIDRAIVLGGMAQQELRAIGDRFGTMLAGDDLIAAALQAKRRPIATSAVILTWHHARAIADPRAARLRDLVTQVLPPETVENGLAPAEVTDLEQQLDAAIAEVAQGLADAGEDPFSPLPADPPPEPP
jgi:nucleotide-binding universal stress UspA family protein